MDISNSWMINLEDHPGTLPGKKTSCPATVQNHFTQSPCRKYMKIWNSHMFPMFPSMKFSRIHGWFLPWNLTPPKKHGTPKETMEPPKSTRIMGKSSTTPRYPWENHTPNPSKFHVEFERLNMIQLYKHIMVLTHIYI